MPQAKQKLFVVLDSAVLDLGLVQDVFRMLGYFNEPQNSPESLKQKGYITLGVPQIHYDSVLGAIGPTITLRNKPRDAHLTIPISYVRCVLEVPDELEVETDRFFGRFV